jgi:DNA-binding NtrC family response regulator
MSTSVPVRIQCQLCVCADRIAHSAIEIGALCQSLFWVAPSRRSRVMADRANLSRTAPTSKTGFGGLVGKSVPMQQLYELVAKVSQTTAPILIQGETGTGKELVARHIHFMGLHQERPFVPVDCSAMTPAMVESELFGHAKGAYAGAGAAEPGLLQAVDGGTIFLDEVSQLSVISLEKLLRTLQEKEMRPVGSSERIPIDVRVIAATKQAFGARAPAKTFRQDLFSRFDAIQITLVPLRERKIDIALLVAHFLKIFSNPSRRVRKITDDALRRLMAYEWPGNVRELENVIECALALGSGTILTVKELVSIPDIPSSRRAPLKNALIPLTELEKRAVVHALEETGGNKPAAARLLGIEPTALSRQFKSYQETAKRNET